VAHPLRQSAVILLTASFSPVQEPEEDALALHHLVHGNWLSLIRAQRNGVESMIRHPIFSIISVLRRKEKEEMPEATDRGSEKSRPPAFLCLPRSLGLFHRQNILEYAQQRFRRMSHLGSMLVVRENPMSRALIRFTASCRYVRLCRCLCHKNCLGSVVNRE